jgi:hypothetical protein
VKRVGAVLDDLVDDCAGVAGELRIHGAGHDVLFFERIRVYRNAFRLERRVIDIDAVQQLGVLRRLVAVARR